MKEKLLDYEVESNGETIKINVVQTEKGVEINILGNTPDVIVNDIVVYSEYEEEEYKYIPPYLRPFIKKYSYDWVGVNVKEAELGVELCIEGTSFLAMLPIRKEKNSELRLRDWIIEYSIIEDKMGITVENGKEKFGKFLKAVKELGCDIRYSHGGNDYDNWYDLVVPMKESVKEETIVECVKLWNEYNQSLLKTYL